MSVAGTALDFFGCQCAVDSHGGGGGFGMFRGGREVSVEVEFDRQQAPYARERAFHPTQQRTELPDGRLLITFETTEAALTQVARWLMQYGEHARALQPAALRQLLRDHLTRAAALYDQQPDEAIINE